MTLFICLSIIAFYIHKKNNVKSKEQQFISHTFFVRFFMFQLCLCFVFFFFVLQHQKVYNSMENTSAVRRFMYLCQYYVWVCAYAISYKIIDKKNLSFIAYSLNFIYFTTIKTSLHNILLSLSTAKTKLVNRHRIAFRTITC